MPQHVTVLMPTYNGAEFLDEQIRSIIDQTYPSWSLVLRDDGSTDGTPEVIARYAAEHANISVIDVGAGNLGVKRSVQRLLAATESDLYMLADQDDVWLPTKIESVVRRAEAEPQDVPLLVFTDLRVVDRDLRLVKPAMHSGMGRTRLSELLVENSVTGCTTLLNRALRDVVVAHDVAADPAVIMHDWWHGIVAAALGKVVFLDESTILYRQHGNNAVGAGTIKDELRRVVQLLSNIDNLQDTLDQAALLARTHGDQITGEARDVLHDWISLPGLSPWGRLKVLRRRRFAKNTFPRTANLYLLVLLFGRRLR